MFNKPVAWVISLLVVLGSLAAITLYTIYKGYYPTPLVVAVPPEDQPTLSLVAAWTQNRSVGARFTVKPVASYAAAAAEIRGETTDLAVIRGDLPIPGNARAVAVPRRGTVLLFSLRPGEIKSVEDLKGRTIGIVGSATDYARMLEAILGPADLRRSDVSIQEISRSSIVDVIDRQLVDAVLAAPSFGEDNIERYRSIIVPLRQKAAIIPLQESATIIRSDPAYARDEILAGTVRAVPPVPAEDVTTFSVPFFLVAQRDLSPTTVAGAFKALMEGRQVLRGSLPQLTLMRPPSEEQDALVEVHPGVAMILHGAEENWFEKNAQLLYYAAWFIGLLASMVLFLTSRLERKTASAFEQGLAALGKLLTDPARQDHAVPLLERWIKEVREGHMQREEFAALINAYQVAMASEERPPPPVAPP